jgi:hypothetical protein
MTTLRSAEASSIAAPTITNPGVLSEMKARQSAKIRELGQALIDAGVRTLDAQADALGLARSTAWTIVKTCHKTSGLSAAIIERMLGSKLPRRARAIIVEYVEEKSFGLYGGSRRQQQRFAVRLSNTIASSSGSEEMPRISCAPRTPKQYEIAEVRTGRGMSRAMLFPKATQAALEANARTNREVMAIKREPWRLRGVC